MKRILMALAITSAVTFGACGGDDGESVEDVATLDETLAGDVVEEVAAPVVKEWHLVEGAALQNFKQVKGFGCNDGWLYVNIDGNGAMAGLYAWNLDEEPALNSVFGGVGATEVLSSGALVADFGTNGTSSIVGVDTEGNATDMGFAFENLEVKNLSYSGSHLVTFSRETSTAYNYVHRAKLPDGPFEQVGPHFVESGMSVYASPTSIYAITGVPAVTGTACHRVDLTAGADATWEDCPLFPSFVMDSPTATLYSVDARIFGHGEKMGIWFDLTDKGEKSAKFFVASDKIKWTEIQGIPELKPMSWFHDGEAVYFGLAKSGGEPAVWTAAWDGEAEAEAIGEGLPGTGDQKGVYGLCRAENQLYAAWFEYGPGGSTLQIYRRAR